MVGGTRYVGLSIGVLLAQNHEVTAVDIVPDKIEKINKCICPIQDEFIEKYMAEKVSCWIYADDSRKDRII